MRELAVRAAEASEAGSNLRLKSKILNMDYETAMRSWLDDPDKSDDEDEDDD